MTREQAAEARSASMAAPSDRPRERRQSEVGGFAAVRAVLSVERVKSVTRDGLKGVVVGGVASTTEDPYSMWDMFGEYTEVVGRGAFGQTLLASPLVEFTINHGAGGGLPMAHTRNSTLTLSETDDGLDYEAFVDPTRSDVADMLKAMERGDLAEASFKFRIDRGTWSPDWSTYRIEQVDLNRGDVSAVNFGANPNATSVLRVELDPAQVERLESAARVAAGLPTQRRTMAALFVEDDLAPFAF